MVTRNRKEKRQTIMMKKKLLQQLGSDHIISNRKLQPPEILTTILIRVLTVKVDQMAVLLIITKGSSKMIWHRQRDKWILTVKTKANLKRSSWLEVLVLLVDARVLRSLRVDNKPNNKRSWIKLSKSNKRTALLSLDRRRHLLHWVMMITWINIMDCFQSKITRVQDLKLQTNITNDNKCKISSNSNRTKLKEWITII